VNYDAATYRLYEDLFKEAHAGLFTKEAQRPGFFSRLFGGRRAVQAAEASEKAMAEQLAQKEQAVEDAMHRMGLMEADVARETGRATRLEESLQRFTEDPEALAKAERARNIWRGVGIGGLGLGAAGVPLAYSSGRSTGEADKRRTRNIAFGAGAAAGLAAPRVIQGLGQIARGTQQTGLFPEMEGYGAY